MDGGLLSGLAENLGTSENILNLFISLLLGYPLAACHRQFVAHRSPFLQHIYFTVCGLLICLFNFGVQTYHSVLVILLIYFMLKTCGGTALSVVLAFAINMTYLTVGYYMTMSDNYLVTWTTPQCVLTLRLIGLVYDVYDGKRSVAALSADEKQTALREVPSLLEISAHSYFFGGFLVGPQFSMKRYKDFVEKRLRGRYDAISEHRTTGATTSRVSAADREASATTSRVSVTGLEADATTSRVSVTGVEASATTPGVSETGLEASATTPGVSGTGLASTITSRVSVTDGSHIEKKPSEQLIQQLQNVPEENVSSCGSGTECSSDVGVDRYPREGDSVKPAMLRLLAGVVYIAVYQIGSGFCSDSLLLDQSFVDMLLIYKCAVIAVWGKLTLCKYLGCWLLAEGACILTGMTYNGRDVKGKELWNGCANIHIRAYETATTCQELILAFNVNTNKWMAKYVFKRLKFLGNKDVSQGVTLFFLAIWHGLHSGYFMNFFLEYLVIKFEREIALLLRESTAVSSLLSLPGGSLCAWGVKKFFTQFILGYALISFCLFSFDKYYLVYSSMYFIGHIFLILLWPILFQVLVRYRQKSKRKSE